MKTVLLISLFNSIAMAAGDKEHSHSMGGELEHAWPVVAIFLGLAIAGFAYNYFANKKK